MRRAKRGARPKKLPPQVGGHEALAEEGEAKAEEDDAPLPARVQGQLGPQDGQEEEAEEVEGHPEEGAKARVPGRSEGMTSPVIWVVRAAASLNIPEARWTLKWAQPGVAPVS